MRSHAEPGNILTREGTDNPLCLIDFGLSRMFVDAATGRNLPGRRTPTRAGTRTSPAISRAATTS